MSRVLGSTRESRTTDESTSTDRQSEQVSQWSALHGHELIRITTDTDTSGKVSPFAREGLGTWLTDPAKIAQWDILVTSKIDRVSRSVGDFADLIEWCDRHRKIYVSVAEGLDLGTPAGRMVAQIIMTFAQYEREMIRSRALDSRAKLRAVARYAGGPVPYGYAKACLCHGTSACESPSGWTLVQDPPAADAVRAMAEMSVYGSSSMKIASWLNEEKVRPPRAGTWIDDSVRWILSSPALLGQTRRRDGKLVRDNSGDPVLFTDEPLLDRVQYDRLQSALKARSQVPGERVGGHMLRQVIFCGHCNKPMYGAAEKKRKYAYYRCKICRMRMSKNKMDDFVEQAMHDGDLPGRILKRRQLVEGDSHGKEIAALEAKLEMLRDIPEVDPGPVADKLAGLKALPHEPDRWEWVPTGETVGDHWQNLDSEGKGQFLRDWKVRLEVTRERGVLRMGWLDPDSATFDAGSD